MKKIILLIVCFVSILLCIGSASAGYICLNNQGNKCRIGVTFGSYTPGADYIPGQNTRFNGVLQADQVCQFHFGYLGGTWMALLGSSVRQAPMSTGPIGDWPMIPNMDYYRATVDGYSGPSKTAIGPFVDVANQWGCLQALDFGQSSGFDNPICTYSTGVWTGFTSEDGSCAFISGNGCNEWTSGSNSLYGIFGAANSQVASWKHQSTAQCLTGFSLYCVEKAYWQDENPPGAIPEFSNIGIVIVLLIIVAVSVWVVKRK